LEKQIEDLTQKLQSADAQYKQKVNIIHAAIFNSEKKTASYKWSANNKITWWSFAILQSPYF